MVTEKIDNAPIPTEEDELNAGQSKVWRITNGKLRYGPGDGTEVLDSIVGAPIRVGCSPEGVTKEGAPIPEKLRVQIKKRDGSVETISVRKDSGQARGIISALVLWNGSAYLAFQPNLGSKPNKYGRIPTYVNIKEFTGTGWVPLRPDYDADTSVDDYCKELAGMYPAVYKDFIPESDEPSPYDALSDWLEANGWQRFAGQGEYLAIIGKALKGTFDTAGDVPQSFWGGAVSAFEHAAKRNHIPDTVKLADDADDDDPFADE